MRHVLALVFVTATILACSASTFPAADAGGAADASTEGGFPAACTVDGGFPGFVKGCSVTAGCVSKLHQIDCCGSMIAIGINHSEATLCDQSELAWENACPKCQCAAKPTMAEDGSTGLNANVKVNCESLTCKTSF
ncbi:MAG TPA: hypothetical protein VF316_21135 [Polyangiaceae bacterium]